MSKSPSPSKSTFTPTITKERMVCILRALAERKPGRYVHQTDHTWTNGSMGSHHVLIVRGDGAVAYAHTSYESGRTAEPVQENEPGQLCMLREPSFFTDCLEAVMQVVQGQRVEGPAWTCSFGDDSLQTSVLDWFERCDAVPAVCE